MKIMSFLATLLLSTLASASIIQNSAYNSQSQTLFLTVVFEGGLKEHNFELAWDSCQTINGVQQTSARLLDSGWDDTGAQTQTLDLQFDLSAVSCKPAELTVRFGRFGRTTLWLE